MKYERKSPVTRSPIGIRGPLVSRPRDNQHQSTPHALTKSEIPRTSDVQISDSHPEYKSLAYEFHALEKMVSDEFGDCNSKNTSFDDCREKPILMYERGRFFDKYSDMRNEKLKRRKMKSMEENTPPSATRPESSKKRGPRKIENVRKSMPGALSNERSGNRRYSLRSLSKMNKN